MSRFHVGDRVRQTPRSAYAPSLDLSTEFEIVNIDTDITLYPIQARAVEDGWIYRFNADEIERIGGVSEGDCVEVTLTGLVIGRGTRYLSVQIDGNESAMPGDRVVYITHDNAKVQIKKEVSQ